MTKEKTKYDELMIKVKQRRLIDYANLSIDPRHMKKLGFPEEVIYLTETSLKELLSGKIIYDDDGRIEIHP